MSLQMFSAHELSNINSTLRSRKLLCKEKENALCARVSTIKKVAKLIE